MAETFHPFPDLPKELRLNVWEQALIEARPDRRIIVYKRRVVPFKQSISPLLLVNHESRTCAKAFYDVKLDVYAIPSLTDGQIKTLDKKTNWERIPGIEKAVDGKIHGYTDKWARGKFRDEHIRSPWEARREIERKEKEYTVDLEDHWATYVEEQLSVLGSKSAARAETSGLRKGAFYISPEHDVFIDGFQCGEHFFNIEDASKIFGTRLKPRLTCHHISATLYVSTRERVSTLVRVRGPDRLLKRHCVFMKDQPFISAEWFGLARRLDLPDDFEWNAKTFQSVNFYFTLSSSYYERPSFLKVLIGADGAELSPLLKQWVKKGEHDLDDEENIALKFKQRKGFFVFDRSERQANWTRDLMAHWDVFQANAGKAPTSEPEQ